MRTKRTQSIQPRETMSFGERIGLLTVKRRELIRPIQEHPRDYVLLSIRDVASSLHSDPATILRIVRSMGFHSDREFKAYQFFRVNRVWESFLFKWSADNARVRSPYQQVIGDLMSGIPNPGHPLGEISPSPAQTKTRVDISTFNAP